MLEFELHRRRATDLERAARAYRRARTVRRPRRERPRPDRAGLGRGGAA